MRNTLLNAIERAMMVSPSADRPLCANTPWSFATFAGSYLTCRGPTVSFFAPSREPSLTPYNLRPNSVSAPAIFLWSGSELPRIKAASMASFLNFPPLLEIPPIPVQLHRPGAFRVERVIRFSCRLAVRFPEIG